MSCVRSADQLVLGSTDACWSAIIAQLEPEVYYVKIDDDIVYIQVRSIHRKVSVGFQAAMQR